LWAREPEVVADINTHHANSAFLPGIALDPRLKATTALADAAAQDAVLMVAPAQHVRTVAAGLAPHLAAGKPVLLCSKGLEQATGKLLGEVLAETIPHAVHAVLSGPSFAADVARGLPAALTLAIGDEVLGRLWPPRSARAPCASTGRATRPAFSWEAPSRTCSPSLRASSMAGVSAPARTQRSSRAASLSCGASARRSGKARRSRRCSAAGARWRRASIRLRRLPAWRRTRASTCRSAGRCTPSSQGSRPWMRPSRRCYRDRRGRRSSRRGEGP